MQAKRPNIVLAALFAALLAACAGGSGSSGFDVTAGLENQLIDEALQGGVCVQGEGLTICPSDQTEGSQPSPGTPGPAADVDVDTTLGGATNVDCPAAVDGPCDFTFSFLPSGLPFDTVYRVAVRAADPLGTWTLGAAPDEAGGVFSAVLQVPEGAPTVQIAILAFAEPEAVTTDTELQTLSASGADFAFVVAPVAVAAPTM